MDPQTRLLEFFRGDGPDSEGRMLDEILAWPDRRWELHHDFIQWVFPTRKASAVNADAPLPSAETIKLFRSDPLLRDNLHRVYLRFVAFLGMRHRDGRLELVERPAYAWPVPNHNWLRITRALDSLNTLGCEADAAELFACLSRLRAEPGLRIDDRTFAFWQSAAKPQ